MDHGYYRMVCIINLKATAVLSLRLSEALLSLSLSLPLSLSLAEERGAHGDASPP